MKKFFWNKKKDQIVAKILPKNFKKMPKWKVALYILFYAAIACTFLLAITFAWFAKDLPTPSKIANRRATESTKLYDRTGQTLLYETGDQKRTIIKSDQIPQVLKDATVATEDSNFYRHHGFDTKAIISSVYGKLTGKTQRTRGASTITQQYVKNALLTSNRSLTRKFKELIISIELEFMYSKDEILTMYLNEIPYGNSTAGVEAAAKMYYGKSAKDLDLAESATIAAIPQAPTYYSPYGTHTKELVARKNYVLDRMVETGKVSEEEAAKAKEKDTIALGETLKPRHDAMLAPHFAMYVLEQVADKYGEEKVQKDGLKIITTLDYDKQKIAEEAIKNGMVKVEKNGGSNGALVSIDPKTGQILAMVGSKDYFDTKIDGNVNVADSLRQPGSSFKVFEYSTLLKKKEYSPSKILFDLQTDFGGGYVPRNYNGNFNGPVTVRYALQNSLNIPAVKSLSLAGMDNTLRTAEDLGINTLTQKNRYGLSLALGVGEVRPVEMANAYGTLANGGNRQDLTPYIKITDSNEKTLYDFDKDHKDKDVLDPQIAYEMSNILSDNNARTPTFGSRSALYFKDRLVAAKTGTTQENRDGWTCGYTPSITTVVWVGNNMPSPMKRDAVDLAGPIFHEFMEKALAGTPAEEFKRPEGIQELEVEKWSNKLPSENSGPDRTKDIFASWQVPTEKDDVHIKVKVCKANGKLAPAGMSDSLTEEKLFTNIHSERPDNPSWENPVRGWAESNGMASAPPTDYCNASDVTPSVSFTAPTDNADVAGSGTISVAVSTSPAISSVEYFIDDISIGTGDAGTPSFVKYYDFSSLSAGRHTLAALATDANGGTVKATIGINVVTGSAIIISSITANPGSNSVTITWTTTVPATSQVFYGTTSATSEQSSLDSSMVTSHSVTISGLNSGTTYYYKVYSADGSNNTQTSETRTFFTLASPPPQNLNINSN